MNALSTATRGSRNVIRLVVGAVLVGAVVWAQMLELPNPDMFDEEPATAASDSARLRVRPAPDTVRRINPGLFRLEIIQFEKALYKPGALFDDGWMVEIRGKELAGSLLKYQEQSRTRAGLAVSRFAAKVGAEMDAAYARSKDYWPEWRKQWERIRRQFFLDADWYTTFDPRGIPLTSAGGPVSPADRAAARQLSDFAADLRAGIRRGRDSALKLPDPPGAAFVNTVEGQRLTRQWRDWTAGWIREIDSLARPYSSSVPASDQNLVRARQQLDSALTALRQFVKLTGNRGFPIKIIRRERLEAALKQVDGARDYLSRVGTL